MSRGALVGRLTAGPGGEYPAWIVVDGPRGERVYSPRPAACSNIDGELGARRDGREGFTCSNCWEQADYVPRFCPGCGMLVKGKGKGDRKRKGGRR